MFRRIGLIVVLAFGCCIAASNQTAQSQTHVASDNLQGYASIAPPYVTPAKNLFVTREGDSFIVAVTATCLLEDDSETQFELLASSPTFVHISEVYRKENKANGYAEGLGLVHFTPQIGDAGKYTVSLAVKACSGKVERVITFKVKVQPALTN